MAKLRATELKLFLDEKVVQFNRPHFIESDPVSIPHLFSKKEDIEIAGFLTALISWGQRPVILKNSMQLMTCMDNSPHQFILDFKTKDLAPFDRFVHRTFNTVDCTYVLRALQNIYRNHGGLEKVILKHQKSGDENLQSALNGFRKIFFSLPHQSRTEKHVPDPDNGSAAKRLNMFLRWMVRNDSSGVDFGIWKKISPALLTCPLDVHSGRVARKLGLLKRKQNDWTAATELTSQLRKMDPADPVKYDFALFGLGVFEKF